MEMKVKDERQNCLWCQNGEAGREKKKRDVQTQRIKIGDYAFIIFVYWPWSNEIWLQKTAAQCEMSRSETGSVMAPGPN